MRLGGRESGSESRRKGLLRLTDDDESVNDDHTTPSSTATMETTTTLPRPHTPPAHVRALRLWRGRKEQRGGKGARSVCHFIK